MSIAIKNSVITGFDPRSLTAFVFSIATYLNGEGKIETIFDRRGQNKGKLFITDTSNDNDSIYYIKDI